MRAIFFGFTVLLIGCTPAKLINPSMPPDESKATVLVYREKSLNAGGIYVIFGADKKDYVELFNLNYAEIYFPAGNYNFFVRSNQADKPFVLSRSLIPGKRECLKASANSSNYAKAALMPFLYHFTSTFALEPIDCPDKNFIDKLEKVEINYQK